MKKILITGLMIFGTMTANFYALDTFEPYNKGLSDLEFYYGNVGGGAHSFSGAMGYGVSNWINPSFNPVVTFAGGTSEFALGIANGANVYSGVVDLDFSLGFTTFSTVGTVDFGTEVTYPYGAFTPYFQGALSVGGGSTMKSFSLGSVYSLSDKKELFVDFNFDVDASQFGGGVGYNFMFMKSIEIIFEAGYSSDFAVSAGFIWTLDPALF